MNLKHHQLAFVLPDPPRVDLDGVVDEKKGVIYIGEATQQFDGTWCCLANVDGALCLVEVKISKV